MPLIQQYSKNVRNSRGTEALMHTETYS